MLPEAIVELSSLLKSFPGIGSRSSQKLALDILQLDQEKYEELVKLLTKLKREVGLCPNCGFFSQVVHGHPQLCSICSDPYRNQTQVCLVEKPTDVIAVEKSQVYKGTYHVLQRLISPLDNIFPENTNVGDLLNRRLLELTATGEQIELIVFFKGGFSAEATMAYVREFIEQKKLNSKIKISRLAQGLPLYFNPDTLDQGTLAKALEDRRTI
jgi:recombination protein RecR